MGGFQYRPRGWRPSQEALWIWVGMGFPEPVGMLANFIGPSGYYSGLRARKSYQFSFWDLLPQEACYLHPLGRCFLQGLSECLLRMTQDVNRMSSDRIRTRFRCVLCLVFWCSLSLRIVARITRGAISIRSLTV